MILITTIIVLVMEHILPQNSKSYCLTVKLNKILSLILKFNTHDAIYIPDNNVQIPFFSYNNTNSGLMWDMCNQFLFIKIFKISFLIYIVLQQVNKQ